MIEDKQIFKAISQIKLRSDRIEEIGDYERTFVDYGVIDELENDNHQILYGRRGTGKTHVLKVLQQRLQREKQTLTIYFDARTLGSTGHFSQEDIAVATACMGLYRDILTRIHWSLLEYVVDNPNNQAEHSLQALDELLAASSEPVEQFSLNQLGEERQYGRSSEAGLTATIGYPTSAKIDLTSSSSTEDKLAIRKSYNIKIDDNISFVRIINSLNDVLDRNGIKVYLIIDEWSSIKSEYQPMLADLIKRSLCVCSKVTVKIAAIEARTNFSRWIGTHRIGFEIGADMFSAPHLDEYYIYGQDETNLMNLYLDVIFNHVRSNLQFDYLRKRYGISDGHTFGDKLLSPKAVVELTRAAEGVIRDLLNIFIIALTKASKLGDDATGKIEAVHVVEAAHQWFERDKLHSIPLETARALAVLERKLIGERKTRFFAIPLDSPRTPLFTSLLDSRLIHSVWRNMSHPERPGARYAIYCLDYGSCLSVVRGLQKYRQKIKYQDLMEDIAIKYEQVTDFNEIVTSDLFGAERGQEPAAPT